MVEIKRGVLDERLRFMIATKWNLFFLWSFCQRVNVNCLAHAIVSVNPAVLHPLPKVITYTSAISGAKIWELRLQYLQDMRAVHVEGNLICYNSMANGADGAWHLALQSLDAVKHQMKADVITSA